MIKKIVKKKILCITPIKHLPGVFEELNKYGDISYKPNINKIEIIKLLKQTKFDALFVNPNKQGFKLDKKVLQDSSIKLINTCSTGVNHIDIKYCKKNGIEVLSLTNDQKIIINLPSTAELAFGLMLILLRKILLSHNSVLKYDWNYLPYVGRQVKDLSVGVVGYGRLGKIFCKQLDGFGAKIIVTDPYVDKCKYKLVSLDSMLPCIDVLVLHVHVSDETRKLINRKTISKIKKGAIIINTSRGELVDERAIIKALKSKHLSGYATDVVEHEFTDVRKSPIIKNADKLPIIVTPHIGGMTIEGQTMAFLHAVKKFK